MYEILESLTKKETLSISQDLSLSTKSLNDMAWDPLRLGTGIQAT